MAYKANKPIATDQISVSQADLIGNFGAIDSFVAVDHAGFGAGTDAGKHFFNQAVAPTAASATQVGIYCAALGGSPELYVNKTATQVPFTKAVKAAKGYTYLPSGIIMQWGDVLMGVGTDVVTDNFLIPFPNGALSFHITANDVGAGNANDVIAYGAAISPAPPVVTGITVTRSNNWMGTAKNFKYLAIGY